MAEGILAKLRTLFEGDPGVRKVANDPALTAELLLLFRVVLADGEVKAEELSTLKTIAREAFGIGEGSFGEVVSYLHDFGYETSGAQAAELFASMPFERKEALIGHMTAIANADHDLDDREVGLIRRTIARLNAGSENG